MKIGCPKEIKPQEFRVGLTPAAVFELTRNGHSVLVETNAGVGAGFSDQDYINAGAAIAETAPEVFAASDMIVKVKEPQAIERKMLREGQLLFTYLHLAPDPEQTKDLLDSGCTAIAYETVTDANGGLPLLAPMSEVAGRLAPQVGLGRCKRQMAGAASCLVAYRVSELAKFLSSVAALSAPMQPAWLLEWAQTLQYWTDLSPSSVS